MPKYEPPTWVRVRDKGTGHEYDVRKSALNPEVHAPLNDDAYPDIAGATRSPRPATAAIKAPTPKKSASKSADGNSNTKEGAA